MITSNTWLKSEVLRDLRNTVLQNGIRKIKNYPKLGEVFKGIGVSVSIVYIDKHYDGEVNYEEIVNGSTIEEYSADIKNDDLPMIPSSMTMLSILNKTHSKEVFNSKMEAKLPFGIESSGKIGTTSDAEIIDTSMIQTDDFNIPILFMSGTDPIYSLFTFLCLVPSPVQLAQKKIA